MSKTPQKTPQKTRKSKEKWFEIEENEFALSTDEQIFIKNVKIFGLKISTEKFENKNVRLLSAEISDQICFISAETMNLIDAVFRNDGTFGQNLAPKLFF